jgi:hypothetical protein
LKRLYEQLKAEHENTLARLRELESNNKKLLDQQRDDKKGSEEDLANKLKLAAEKISTLSQEKTKLEGYLRTAKTVCNFVVLHEFMVCR